MRCRALLFGLLFSIFGCVTWVNHVSAAPQEVPSCYDLVQIEDIQRPAIQHALYVLIDQTLVFDHKIQSLLNQKIQKFLRAGDRIVVVTFSAYVNGRYSEVVLDGRMDLDISENDRFTISKKKLEQLDLCRMEQEKALRNLIAGHLKKAFDGASSELPKTQLIANLATLSRDIMTPQGEEKVYVLVVSDMLENSSVTSFYASGSLRNLSPSAELSKIEKAGMLGSFGGASVYIAGAGYNQKGDYRSATSMKGLEDFWHLYFKSSQAQVREFGTPLLLGEIDR